MADKNQITRRCNNCNLSHTDNAKYCRKCGMTITGFGTVLRDLTRSGTSLTKAIVFHIATGYAAFNLFSVLLCLAMVIIGLGFVGVQLQAFGHFINLVTFQKGAVDILIKNPLEIIILVVDVAVGSVLAILIPSSILTKLIGFIGLIIPIPDPVTKGVGGSSATVSLALDIIIAILILILAIFATIVVLFVSLVSAVIINLFMIFVVIKNKKVPLFAFFYGFFCIFTSIVLLLNIKSLLLPSFLPIIFILLIFASGCIFIIIYILQILNYFGVRVLDNTITKCSTCNGALTAKLNNCTYCGRIIFSVCKGCNEKYNNELNYCPNCGVENHNNHQFCILCGKKSDNKLEICKSCSKTEIKV